MLKTNVLKHFNNSVNDTAEAFGVSHSAVSQWGNLIPEKQALRAALLTNGALAYEPELYIKAKENVKATQEINTAA